MSSNGFNVAEIVADTIVGQNADFFAADFQIARGMVCRISVQEDTGVVVRLVPSSGTDLTLNGGAALTAGVRYVEDVALDSGRTWNIQTAGVGGTTVQYALVQELTGA